VSGPPPRSGPPPANLPFNLRLGQSTVANFTCFQLRVKITASPAAEAHLVARATQAPAGQGLDIATVLCLENGVVEEVYPFQPDANPALRSLVQRLVPHVVTAGIPAEKQAKLMLKLDLDAAALLFCDGSSSGVMAAITSEPDAEAEALVGDADSAAPARAKMKMGPKKKDEDPTARNIANLHVKAMLEKIRGRKIDAFDGSSMTDAAAWRKHTGARGAGSFVQG
jgi:hypothetical protein